MYARLPDLVFVVSMAARQEVIQDEIGDVATEPVPTRQVVAEMHARENAALRGFVRRRREARERALYPREHFRSHGEVEMVPLKDRNQDGGASGADHGVSARIRGIGRRVADL